MPEDGILHSHRLGNLKSYTRAFFAGHTEEVKTEMQAKRFAAHKNAFFM
jgi:hypothetical protein